MAHVHHHPVPVPATEQQGVRRGAAFIIGGLTSGHGVFHWFTQSLIVMLPEVRAFFGLGAVEVGAITTVREVTSGLISLPGGVLTDLLRRFWGLVLAGCMALFGVGWLVMGFSPVYPLLLVGMALVAMASSTWHLPAMAALSHHFAHRRGSALSFHGVGGNIGDVAAPAVTGFLLVIMAWQDIIKIYAVIPMFLAFAVFWAFRDIGRSSDAEHRQTNLQAQMAQTRALLKSPRLWAITLVAGIRGMAFISFLTFLPLYLTDELNLSVQVRGLYIALLVLVGIGFMPLMGYLSDRFNRKLVLIPGMLFLGALTLLLVPFAENSIALIAILALLGTFLFSDQPILTAAALDIVGAGVAATTLGVLSFSRFILAAASPLIGGALYQMNFDFTFFYIASLFGLATLILLFIPLPRVEHAGHDHGHSHEETSSDTPHSHH